MSNISKDIQEWIDRISKIKNGYQVCPYAKKATYHIFENEDMFSMQIKACNYVYDVDLLICIPTDKFMSIERAQFIENNINKIATDTITLLDHPDDPGYIADTYTGNGKHIIFLIQKRKNS